MSFWKQPSVTKLVSQLTRYFSTDIDENDDIESDDLVTDNEDNENEESLNGTIKFEWIEKMMDMGFSYEKVVEALTNTNSAGYNEALDYLMQNV